MNTVERPLDYPLRVRAAFEPKLSRGVWLVKWLLAIPHYLIVAVFVDAGWTLWGGKEWVIHPGGLISLMALIAGVILLFTARYPRPIYDFLLGMNRWVFRVGAYVLLMIDRYPPFRLDMGGEDPSPGATASASRPTPSPAVS